MLCRKFVLTSIKIRVLKCTTISNLNLIQSNLSIPDTLGPNKTVLIIEVSLFQRFINTHYYCIGTDTTCPDYRGVLILDCPQ